ncbi:MAG: PAS domain S-box protein, partial [Armatimonadota bacterium]
MPDRIGPIIDNVPLLIVSMREDGTIRYVNSYACNLTGFAPHEIVNRKFWEMLSPDEAEKTRKIFDRFGGEQIPPEYECQVCCGDDCRTVEWRTATERNEEDEIEQILAFGLDVTEQRKAQQRLDHLNRVLMAIREVNQIIVRVQAQETLIQKICDSMVATRGYEYAWSLLEDDDAVEYFYGAPLDDQLEDFRKDLESGWRPPCLTADEDPTAATVNEANAERCVACPLEPFAESTDALVINLRHRNTDYGKIAVRIPKGMAADEREIRLFEEVAADIAFALAGIRMEDAHRRADEKLREQSELLEAFFEHIQTPVALLDCDFNFIRVNEAYAEADERASEDFPGENHFDMYPSDARDVFEQVVRSGEPYEVKSAPFEYARNPERGVTYWDWSLIPVKDDDGVVEMLVLSMLDVTEQERANREIRRRQEDLRELAAELSRTEQEERRRIASQLHDNLGQILTLMKMKLGELGEVVGGEVAPALNELQELVTEATAFTRSMQFDLSPPILYELGLEAGVEWLDEQFEERHALT